MRSRLSRALAVLALLMATATTQAGIRLDFDTEVGSTSTNSPATGATARMEMFFADTNEPFDGRILLTLDVFNTSPSDTLDSALLTGVAFDAPTQQSDGSPLAIEFDDTTVGATVLLPEDQAGSPTGNLANLVAAARMSGAGGRRYFDIAFTNDGNLQAGNPTENSLEIGHAVRLTIEFTTDPALSALSVENLFFQQFLNHFEDLDPSLESGARFQQVTGDNVRANSEKLLYGAPLLIPDPVTDSDVPEPGSFAIWGIIAVALGGGVMRRRTARF